MPPKGYHVPEEMTRNDQSDQAHLLQHAASFADSLNPTQGYELDEIASGDITSHKGSISSEYSPSYTSLPDGGQNGGDTEDSASLCQRSTSSFSNRPSQLPSRKSKVRNAYERSMRFILRSGAYAPHISYQRAHPKGQEGPHRWSGWRGGCLAAATLACLVLLINLTFTIWAAAKSQSGMKIGAIYEGDCQTVQRSDSRLHIAINALGTLLLGASNYTMQCLSSPTRSEVDEAHSQGKYLDIGLPSFRNLSGWLKKLLFALLAISTMPLHFLWNSAIFTTTQALNYDVFLDESYTYFNLEYSGPYFDGCSTSLDLLTHQSQLVRLSNEECINTYGRGNTLTSQWGNVLVVTKALLAESNLTVLMEFKYSTFVSNWTDNNWVCGSEFLRANEYHCDYTMLAADASSWSLGQFVLVGDNDLQLAATEEYQIDYCMAQPTDFSGKCQLQYSLIIMTVVVIANAVKLICICLLLVSNKEPVLATIGDGIATFLQRPDTTTIERPFLTRDEARHYKPLGARRAAMWNKTIASSRWWQAPSKTRWIVTLLLCSIAIIVSAVLLANGNTTFKSSFQTIGTSPYSTGFGVYNQYAILDLIGLYNYPKGNQQVGSSSFNSNGILLAMVAIANLPQFIVSSLYFAYNTIYTSMLSGSEWSRFSVQRKALRTTTPRGQQRSTYWLSLPWTYAVPLSVSAALLHWFLSQSLFIVRTEWVTVDGDLEDTSYMNIGYSPLAILTSLLFGSFLVLVMIANGLRKYPPSILVGNNSLAIAAACHRPEGENDAHLKKVMWGAVSHGGGTDKLPGHCCFTAGKVKMPNKRKKYI